MDHALIFLAIPTVDMLRLLMPPAGAEVFGTRCVLNSRVMDEATTRQGPPFISQTAVCLRKPDDYKVLRALVAQMPMIHQAAALEQVDVMDAAEGMLRLIELGHFRLLVHADGVYELVATDR
jgi:hypothetical protein